jgi:hypothetical protein
MKALFICKNRIDSYGISFGLLNSASFVANTLNENGIEAKVITVTDANGIDKAVTEYNPTHIFIEALWVTSEKFEQLLHLPRHKNREWIVRIHSKVPFIANEGIAFSWLSDYRDLINCHYNFSVSCNSFEFNSSLSKVLNINSVYLPNIYNPKERGLNCCFPKSGNTINIGCFGAIRPLKNTLNQALAAIVFADEMGFNLNFHINSGREEQKGDQVFKNLEALFEASYSHRLIKQGWMNHHDFIHLVRSLDLGMQVSLSETFNIVAADFVSNNVPVVVSPEIDWMPCIYKADPSSVESMVRKLKIAYYGKYVGLQKLANWKLNKWNKKATNIWLEYMGI